MTIRRKVHPALRGLKLHLLEHRAAEEAIGTRQRLVDLEVIVALGDDEPHRLAGGRERGREVNRARKSRPGIRQKARDRCRSILAAAPWRTICFRLDDSVP
jgi:hypothetical protein